MTNRDPGSVEISSISLPGVGDVSNFLVSCTITESIDSPGVICRLDVNQQQGLQGSIQGGDAKIRFSSVDGKPRTYNLAFNNFSSGTDSPNQKNKTQTIELVSNDMIKNYTNSNYQKAHKNTKVSDMIQTTLKNGLKTDKKINVSDTIGMRGTDNMTYVQTQRTPIEHVHRLSQYNAVGKNKDDSFMSWLAIGDSGKEEWNIKTLSELTKQGPVATYRNDTITERNKGLGGGDQFTIIEVMRGAGTQTMSRAAGGHYEQPTKFNMTSVSGDRARNPIGDGMESKVAKMGPNSPGRSFGQSDGKAATRRISWEDSRESGKNLGNVPDTSASRRSGVDNLNQGAVTVKVPGNSNISVGQMIQLDLRESNESGQNLDTDQSGKHLVTGVTHYIGPVTDNPRYVTYITCSNITGAKKKFA